MMKVDYLAAVRGVSLELNLVALWEPLSADLWAPESVE